MASLRTATAAELSRWDSLISANQDGGHILQTRAWGEFKRMYGWVPLYLIAQERETATAVLALRRGVPGLGQLWYLPKGPGVGGPAALAPVVDALRQARGAFAVKIEPEIEDGDDTRRALRRFGLARARHDIQITRATIVVDLRPDEDAILASFKPKTRYNIRLAARRGVRVDAVPVNDTTMGAMYELMQATQQRAGFTLRPREYFRRYWRLQAATGQGQLFFATWREQTLAGAFVTRLAAKAWYKDGGSTKEHADLMAPHLLQWEVMRWLRRHGTASYDLVAVPARAELHAQHPLFGLYRFKSGFSEHIREYVGTWDLVLSPPRYRLWDAVVERAQHQWAYRVRHDLLY